MVSTTQRRVGPIVGRLPPHTLPRAHLRYAQLLLSKYLHGELGFCGLGQVGKDKIVSIVIIWQEHERPGSLQSIPWCVHHPEALHRQLDLPPLFTGLIVTQTLCEGGSGISQDRTWLVCRSLLYRSPNLGQTFLLGAC